MNRSRLAFLGISLALLMPLVSGVLWSTAASAGAAGSDDSIYKYLSIFSEVFSLVRSNYVDPTDSEQLLAGAIDGTEDALDPFSAVIRAGEMPDYEKSLTDAVPHSGLVLGRDRGVAYVVSVEEGSPAASAGFERGDVLAELGGAETRVMPLWKLERQLAGAPGTKLDFRIVRDGETMEKSLVLGTFTPAAPRLEQAGGFPLLRLPRIVAGTVDQVRPLLAGLASSSSPKLLVDLRGSADGDIEAAYRVGGLFADGELGRLDRRGETVRSFANESAPVWKGEIVALVDGGTLGAAEILAAILRDRAGAKLVGVPTFGWAGERSYFDLSDGAKLHLTSAFYTGPDGQPISKSLEPGDLVDELSRSFGEAEKPLDELILERGIRLLGGEPDETRHAA